MKDILEEAKECLNYYEADDPEWPYGLVNKLISEVEKLRNYKYSAEKLRDRYGDHEREIESLTKELESTQERLGEKCTNLRDCAKGKQELAHNYYMVKKELEAAKESLLHETTSLQTAANKYLKKQNAELNEVILDWKAKNKQLELVQDELREKVEDWINHQKTCSEYNMIVDEDSL